ncbi:CLUMA_CG013694, isoform A [Clunio marinus]|uniref:CLUMA_CG013694, isoform A n=1 Tax=Clunio marinus TaxID=568069 RepID=A0A1J1ILI6_9DIPT|nr:CLUMA_CG013694, isoform A [Clunio marinus]
MLKHVHISPLRNRLDSISLRSSATLSSSSSCTTSLCGSPEPHSDTQLNTQSRSSSYTSLTESISQTTLKVYTACLRLDIEYKTLAVSWDSTAKQIVTQVLRRCKMRHRDPRLFYLSMEVRIRRADARTMLTLDDSARPAMLQACHPAGESKFHLQMKSGGLIRVHTSALQQTSQYKSLLISEQTTSDELLTLLLSCYNSTEPVEEFSLYEVCPDQEYQRKLHPDDLPLRAQIQRNQKGENCHFLVRRIRNLSRRTIKLEDTEALTKLNYSMTLIPSTPTEMSQTVTDIKPLECLTENTKASSSSTSSPSSSSSTPSSIAVFKSKFSKLESCLCKLSLRCDYNDEVDVNGNVVSPQKFQRNSSPPIQHCIHCKRKSSIMLKGFHEPLKHNPSTSAKKDDKSSTSSTYNPVYNVREIRSVGNSFSSLGIDKKLMELDAKTLSSLSSSSRRHSVAVDEIVNAHPSKGIGNYLYI